MRHFLFFLGLLFRRQEYVPGETEFLGFEAFTRPTDTKDPTTARPEKAGARASSSADQELPKAA